MLEALGIGAATLAIFAIAAGIAFLVILADGMSR